MFERRSDPGAQYIVIALLVVAILGVLVFIFAKHRDRLPMTPEAALRASVEAHKPLETIAMDGMKAHVESAQRRLDAQRAERAAAREANRPKAYRWKDADGTWHLSDQAPPDGTAVEIIPLERL